MIRPRPETAAATPRVAYVSPMPPARTGIATYSAAVLRALDRSGYRARREIDVVWPVEERHLFEFHRYRLSVFHIGNNIEFHGGIYRLASNHPGVVVLHDLGLDDFVRGLMAQGDPLGIRAVREALLRAPDVSLPEARGNDALSPPWSAHIARIARGIIVHSDFCRRYLEDFGCRTPTFVVPHPLVEREDDLRRAEPRGRAIRERLGLGRDDPLVVAAGDLAEAKQLPALLAAVARLGAPCSVALVGRRIPGYDVDAIVRQSGLGSRVTLASDVSDEDFRAWLVAADVVVDLRFPHRGEVSGTLIRAMQVGRACVVSGIGTYLDITDGVVVHVGAGTPDPDELATALRGLVADRERRERLGSAARRYVEATASDERTAQGYEEAIERTLALALDPQRPALGRWARALNDLGIGAEQLDAGWGLSYARGLQEIADEVHRGEGLRR